MVFEKEGFFYHGNVIEASRETAVKRNLEPPQLAHELQFYSQKELATAPAGAVCSWCGTPISNGVCTDVISTRFVRLMEAL